MAVIVSLHLARRDRKIRLEVSAGHRLIVTPGTPGPHPEYLSIRIVNIGHREAQLTNIGWKVGLFKKQYSVLTDELRCPLPVRLRDGEEANYLIPLNEKTNWIKEFNKDMLQPYPRIRSYFLKIQACTSVGDKFEARIEKGLRKKLVAVVQNEANDVET